jgi:hypothetical protein
LRAKFRARASGLSWGRPANISARSSRSRSACKMGAAQSSRRRPRWAHSLSFNPRRTAPPICPDLICDRHRVICGALAETAMKTLKPCNQINATLAEHAVEPEPTASRYGNLKWPLCALI